MDEPLHNLVDRIAVQHVCTRPNVLDAVSKWLSMHANDGMETLTDVLEIYGGLRDLGYPHEEVLHGIKYIHSLWFLLEMQKKPSRPYVPPEPPEFRLVRED